MASKQPVSPSKHWNPNKPLRVEDAIVNPQVEHHISESSEHVIDNHPSHVNNTNPAVKPSNHKPFNRQKKG